MYYMVKRMIQIFEYFVTREEHVEGEKWMKSRSQNVTSGILKQL